MQGTEIKSIRAVTVSALRANEDTPMAFNNVSQEECNTRCFQKFIREGKMSLGSPC